MGDAHGRRVALAVLLTLLAAIGLPRNAAGVGDRPPGTTSEIQSEFGDARVAATPDGLLVSRPSLGVVQRLRPGSAPVVVASGIDGVQLVAWDPATDDAIVTTVDGDILRVANDGTVATVVEALAGPRALDVSSNGAIYVGHLTSTGNNVVSAFLPDGTRRVVAEPGLYVTALAVEVNGDVVIAKREQLYRLRVDGTLEWITGSLSFCPPRHPCGDEGPARAAKFSDIVDIDVGGDGSIYVAERLSARVRVIRPDGTIHHFLGSYIECVKIERADCLPTVAPSSAIQEPVSIALSGSSLYVVDGDDAGRWIRLLEVHGAPSAPTARPQGYRLVATDGGIFTFGWSPYWGSTGGIRLVSPVVSGRSNGGDGYWFVAGDGGVFTFGNAAFFGSASGRTSSPVVDIEVRPDGRGYATVERNGPLASFGAATPFLTPDPPPYAAVVNVAGGAMRAVAERPSLLPRLNAPLVAAHATRSARGTWYVASDGGVFTDGDADFFGSTGGMTLNQPVLDLVPTPTERGYWLIAADGGVFSFGDAEFHGSMGAVPLNRPVVAGMPGPDR